MTDVLHSRLFKAGATAALAAIVLALTYAAVRYLSPAPAPVREKLSIALPSSTTSSLLYIAAEKGYFAEEALDLTMIPVSHGVAAIDLVIEGKAELAAAAEVPFVLSVMRGQALGIAASMVSASNDITVVARRDRGITAPRDLAGKKIGVTFGASSEYFLWALFIRHKIAPESVTLVDILPGRIAQALAAGSIDAIATWHPIVTSARAALGANAVSFTEPKAYTQTFVVIARSQFLKEHPVAIQKLLRGLLKAEQFIRSRPQEAIQLVAEPLKIDPETLRATWGIFDFTVELMQSHLIAMEDEARWVMARGYVKKGAVPNFLPHLYLDALLAVRPERVTVVY